MLSVRGCDKLTIKYKGLIYSVNKIDNINRFLNSYSVYQNQNFIGRMIANDFKLEESAKKFLISKGL